MEAVFNISKFSKWPPFSACDKIFTGSYTGSWTYQKDSHEHFGQFELLIYALAQILTEIYQSKNLTYFVTRWRYQWRHEYMYLHKCSDNLTIPLHRKFCDDIFPCFLVIIKNVVIPFINKYRGPTLRPPCDVIDDVIIMKILFWQNLGRLFHIWGQIETVLNISKFSKWPPFWARDFFTGNYTGSWIYQKDCHEHFRHFELLIDALAQILTEIYQFQNLTYFVILWRHQWRHECVKHNLHNWTSPTMHLQNNVCVAPVLHSQIVRTNIVTNIDTHTHTNKQTSKHTGWKHYHLANAGDKYGWYKNIGIL